MSWIICSFVHCVMAHAAAQDHRFDYLRYLCICCEAWEYGAKVCTKVESAQVGEVAWRSGCSFWCKYVNSCLLFLFEMRSRRGEIEDEEEM